MRQFRFTRTGQVFNRIVLPLVLFVGIVGGIAWLTQYMPNWQGKNPPPQPPQSGIDLKPLIQFDKSLNAERSQVKAVWDPNDPNYAMEFEQNIDGHYDYPFENISGEQLTLGLYQSSCDCMRMEATSFPSEDASKTERNWTTLVAASTEGITVAPQARGIVRVNWKSKKQEGLRLNLNVKIWVQPQGKISERQVINVETPVITRSPLLFESERKHLGALDGKTNVQIMCWSATRDKMQVALDEKKADPCYQFTIHPLGQEELAKFQATLGSTSRAKVAYRLVGTVYEEKDGKYLDQGHFEHRIGLLVDGEEATGPVVHGVVRSELDIGSTEDQGKIQLKSFPGQDGVRKVIPLSSGPQTQLTVVGQKPSVLKVKLTKNEKESNSSRALWNLEVTVPPQTFYGPLPDDSVIILRSQNTQTRMIRIPVVGIAGQG